MTEDRGPDPRVAAAEEAADPRKPDAADQTQVAEDPTRPNPPEPEPDYG
jgi:hypothetical protein